MDVPRALALAEEFLALTDKAQVLYDGGGNRYFELIAWQEANREIEHRIVVMRRLAEAVDQNIAHLMMTAASNYVMPWSNARKAASQLVGTLQRQADLDAVLGPTGPQIAASRLHRWVWDPAAELWDDGHRRAAIQAAATSVDNQLQAKLERYDLSGTDLVAQAFSTKAPEPGKPRLRFTKYPEGSDLWTSAHEGAVAFGRGCMLAIRNIATHDGDEPEEQEALERLAALSVLARMIDEAELTKV